MLGVGDAAEERIMAMAIHHTTRAAILAAVGMADAAVPTAAAMAAATVGTEAAILAATQAVIRVAIQAAMHLMVAVVE